MQESLRALGYLDAVSGHLDEPTRTALDHFYGTENFEERIYGEDVIDALVFGFLAERARKGRADGSGAGNGPAG